MFEICPPEMASSFAPKHYVMIQRREVFVGVEWQVCGDLSLQSVPGTHTVLSQVSDKVILDGVR